MSLELRTIGLIEHDAAMGDALLHCLALEGANVVWWRTGAEALSAMNGHRPDAVVCDLRLPDGSGEAVFQTLADQTMPPPFLFMTGHGDVDQAVRLLRSGAGDYMTKPFDMQDFLLRLGHLVRSAGPLAFNTLGASKPMRAVERLLARVAPVSSNLLIFGETGSGKEICARHVHALRSPQPGPFVAVNCAAIPADLLESELFGHERGAFTGAQSRHLGYAERAGTGVLFLDEIGELPPKLQSKLLRLIEDRSFCRVGGEQTLSFRARLICATNADLDRLVRTGQFRQDLYYRINVVTVTVPPLRDRTEDILWLADRFFCELNGLQNAGLRGFSRLAAEALERHAWPGNVRELRNRVERAVALSLGPWIMPGDLFADRDPLPDHRAGSTLKPLQDARDEAERLHILRALDQTDGVIGTAAKMLGVSRTTLWEKMRRFGIDGIETTRD